MVSRPPEAAIATKGKAQGKHFREGISFIELADMFPGEASATRWFETQVWGVDGDDRCCPRCGGFAIKSVPNAKPMPYWCRDCRKYFSVRTGTLIERSKVPLRKWAIAIYLYLSGLKGISSMRLHRELGVTQKTAWFMLHRIRAACEQQGPFEGEAEVDEGYFGGRAKNMHAHKRAKLTGRGTADKTYMGVYHKMSPQHLHLYVCEFAGRHNIRERDTVDRMRHVVANMVGKRLMYKVLTGEEAA